MATKNPIFTFFISGSPTITLEKLIGSENYLSWSASVEQGYEDHLITPKDAIPNVDKVQDKASHVPPAPYPHRLRSPNKVNNHSEIYELFKQVKLKIPLIDAIK